jgi:hypothetical protein
MQYRTQLRGTKDGRGTFGIASVMRNGAWCSIGTTRTYWTYSTAVRARSNAETLCRRHHEAYYPQLPISIHKH